MQIKINTTGAGGAVITDSKKIHKTISYLSTQAKMIQLILFTMKLDTI